MHPSSEPLHVMPLGTPETHLVPVGVVLGGIGIPRQCRRCQLYLQTRGDEAVSRRHVRVNVPPSTQELQPLSSLARRETYKEVQRGTQQTREYRYAYNTHVTYGSVTFACHLYGPLHMCLSRTQVLGCVYWFCDETYLQSEAEGVGQGKGWWSEASHGPR